jgi:DNA-binding transcriptional MocR family regulator
MIKMTYLKDSTEYLTADDKRVWDAVKVLNDRGRTTNHSQIVNATGLSRSKIGQITAHLRRRGYLRDVSKNDCAAYHWRVTDKAPVTEDWTPAEAAVTEPEPWTPERAANPDTLADYGGELIGGPVAYGDQSCIQFPDVDSAASWARATRMRTRVTFATPPVSLTNPVRVWLDHSK